MVVWLLGLIILGTAAAKPRIVLPINSQVPPVARASQTFHFEFAESTFSDDLLDTTYTLSGPPGWLQLDSFTRSLFGTPGTQDAGPVSFDVVATDSSGSTAMPVTLIVSTTPGPALGRPVAEQLPRYGAFSGPESLILSRSSHMALTFSSDTFTNTDGSTVYYALCANNTPLPSWIYFNANTLSFSGTTPQSTSPVELPQTYDIQLTASDVVGFSGAIASFQLVVQNHVLMFSPGPQIVEFTPGVDLKFSGLRSALILDGKPINASELSGLVADTPSWLLLETSSLTLSGTPPTNASSLNFTVSVMDVYGDQATTVVCLVLANKLDSTLFVKPVEPTNASIGSHFGYSLADIVNPDPALKISVALEQAPWLKYDSKMRKLQGQVPSTLDSGHVFVNITVIGVVESQSQVLEIKFYRGAGDVSSQTASGAVATTSRNSVPSASATDAASRGNIAYSVDRHRKNWLAAAVAVPLLIVVGILLLLCWCRRRRRKRQMSGTSPFIISKHDISRPQLILAEKIVGKNGFEHIDNLDLDTKHHKREPSKAPILADLRRYSNRWSGLASAYHSAAAFSELDQRPQYQLAPEDYERLSQTDKASSRKRRSSTVPGGSGALGYTTSKRYSRPRRYGSNMSVGSSNAPFSCYLSGIGHGRNGFSRSSIGRGRSIGLGHGNGGSYSTPEVRRSWRNPLSLKSHSTDWQSTEGGSEQSEFNFPRPPTSDTLGAMRKPYTIHEGSDDTADYRQQPTIRPVIPSAEDLWPERRAYLENRARSRHGDNVLFSAKDTRASSQLLSGKLLRNSTILEAQPKPNPEPPTTPTETASDKENSNPTTGPSHSQPQKSSPSYSRSSSLSPPLQPSPSKCTPHRPRKSNLFRHFPVRAISPLRPRSTLRSNGSLNSRFRDAESDFDNPDSDVELRLEVDEEGQKKWKHVDKPNPLGSNSVRESILSDSRLGVGDRDGSDGNAGSDHPGGYDITALLSASEGSRAQRLSALRGRNMEFGAGGRNRDGGWEEQGQEQGQGQERVQRRLHLGSQRAKRPVSVANAMGSRPGGGSMRGDLGDVGAFI